jgi:hypothetical protein
LTSDRWEIALVAFNMKRVKIPIYP